MRKVNGHFLILIAAVFWSTAGLFTRIVTTDIPTTLFWRSFFGGLTVLIIVLSFRRSTDLWGAFQFTRGEVIISTLSTAGMICFISSFFYTSIANVSFIYGTMPLVTYLLSLLILRDKSNLIAWLCCILSTFGVLIITAGNSEFDDYLGITLAFGMTFFMATLTVATKFYPTVDTLKSTYLSAFLGALIMIPFADFQAVTIPDYGWLWLYGVFNVGLGFGVYLLGVERVTALAAALIGLVEIPLAPIFAWFLFSEKVNQQTIIGGIIILASVTIYIFNNGRKKGIAT